MQTSRLAKQFCTALLCGTASMAFTQPPFESVEGIVCLPYGRAGMNLALPQAVRTPWGLACTTNAMLTWNATGVRWDPRTADLTTNQVLANLGNDLYVLKEKAASNEAERKKWRDDTRASMISAVNTVDFAKQESVIKAIAPLVG